MMKGKWYYSIADYANLLMVILFHQTILLLGEYVLKVSPSLLYAGILAADINDFTELFRERMTALADSQFLRILAENKELHKGYGFVKEILG